MNGNKDDIAALFALVDQLSRKLDAITSKQTRIENDRLYVNARINEAQDLCRSARVLMDRIVSAGEVDLVEST